MNRVLRIGVFGASPEAVEEMVVPARGDGRLEIVAVADADIHRAEAFGRAHNVSVFRSYEELLRHPDIDAVYLSVNPSLHEDIAVGCNERGKHVLCKSPVGLNAGQAGYMVECARNFGRVLMESYPLRYHPVMTRALQLIAEGVIGHVVNVQARCGATTRADASMSLGAEVDLDHLGYAPIRWCRLAVGEEPEITALDRRDGQLSLSLRFPGGAVGTIGCDASGRSPASLVITGERGSLRIADPIQPDRDPRLIIESLGKTSIETFGSTTAARYQLDAFISAIRGEATAPTGGQDAVRQMQMMDRLKAWGAGSLDGCTRLKRLQLTDASVADMVWQFGQVGAHPFSSHIKLVPDGRIGGHTSGNERRWHLDEGVLVFIDEFGRVSNVFDEVYVDDEGRLLLVSEFKLVGSSANRHLLREIEPINGLCPRDPNVSLVVAHTLPGRRNLVVLGADKTSLHTQWPRNISNEDRSWDLCLNWYGAPEDLDSQDVGEIRTLQNGAGKYKSIYKLFHEGSPLWDYDYVLFLDDDLMMSWSDINELFQVCWDFDLQIAQPSLDPKGVAVHAITRHRPEFLLRYTSFVESMAPVFARSALMACMPTFKGSTSGFGLDNIWPKLIGEPRNSVAIIDKIVILHTRPTGANYSLARAVGEGNELERRYGSPSKVIEYGAIFASPAKPAS